MKVLRNKLYTNSILQNSVNGGLFGSSARPGSWQALQEKLWRNHGVGRGLDSAIKFPKKK